MVIAKASGLRFIVGGIARKDKDFFRGVMQGPGTDWCVAFSRDGRLVLSAGQDGTVPVCGGAK